GFGTDIGELEKPLSLLADFPFFSLNGLFGIDLVRPEIGGHGGGRAKYRPLQETGKAVHRIGGRQKRAFALAGEPSGRRARQNGLPHATISAKTKAFDFW